MSEPPHRPGHSSWTTASSFLAALAALVTAVGGLVAIVGRDGDDPAPPVQSVATPTATTAAAGCPERFRVTSPREGQGISNRDGVLIAGTACSDARIWVFDYDPGDEVFFTLNDEPLGISGEQWSFRDKPIGDSADPVGTPYVVVALSASPTCSDELEALEESVFAALPEECPEGTGDDPAVRRVRIVKARP